MVSISLSQKVLSKLSIVARMEAGGEEVEVGVVEALDEEVGVGLEVDDLDEEVQVENGN